MANFVMINGAHATYFNLDAIDFVELDAGKYHIYFRCGNHRVVNSDEWAKILQPRLLETIIVE